MCAIKCLLFRFFYFDLTWQIYNWLKWLITIKYVIQVKHMGWWAPFFRGRVFFIVWWQNDAREKNKNINKSDIIYTLYIYIDRTHDGKLWMNAEKRDRSPWTHARATISIATLTGIFRVRFGSSRMFDLVSQSARGTWNHYTNRCCICEYRARNASRDKIVVTQLMNGKFWELHAVCI